MFRASIAALVIFAATAVACGPDADAEPSPTASPARSTPTVGAIPTAPLMESVILESECDDPPAFADGVFYEYGAAHGDVRNVSAERVTITIEAVFYAEDGRHIGDGVTTVRNLSTGDTAIWAVEHEGPPEAHDCEIILADVSAN